MDLTGTIGGGIALAVVAVDKVLQWRRSGTQPPSSPQGRPGSIPDAPSLEFVVQQLQAKVGELAAAVEELKRARNAEEMKAEWKRLMKEAARELRAELRGKDKDHERGGSEG